MLAEHYGRLIREARANQGLSQENLAKAARVSRAVLSKLEQGKSQPVQSDTLERLLAVLHLGPLAGQSSADLPRRIARLEEEVRRRERRERHLRLALDLDADARGRPAKIARARERVELWRRNRSCSPFYIARWSRLLALPPRKLAKAMASLGEWEDAMFQNSPWSWAWT